MIVYALVHHDDSWHLFVTTDESDHLPGREKTWLMGSSASRFQLFPLLLRYLSITSGDVWVEKMTDEEYSKLRHPSKGGAPNFLTRRPQGVDTYLALVEIVKNNR